MRCAIDCAVLCRSSRATMRLTSRFVRALRADGLGRQQQFERDAGGSATHGAAHGAPRPHRASVIPIARNRGDTEIAHLREEKTSCQRRTVDRGHHGLVDQDVEAESGMKSGGAPRVSSRPSLEITTAQKAWSPAPVSTATFACSSPRNRSTPRKVLRARPCSVRCGLRPIDRDPRDVVERVVENLVHVASASTTTITAPASIVWRVVTSTALTRPATGA